MVPRAAHEAAKAHAALAHSSHHCLLLVRHHELLFSVSKHAHGGALCVGVRKRSGSRRARSAALPGLLLLFPRHLATAAATTRAREIRKALPATATATPPAPAPSNIRKALATATATAPVLLLHLLLLRLLLHLHLLLLLLLLLLLPLLLLRMLLLLRLRLLLRLLNGTFHLCGVLHRHALRLLRPHSRGRRHTLRLRKIAA